MDTETSGNQDKDLAETAGGEADGFRRIWYRSLEGTGSRTERRAIQLVRAVRHLLPLALIMLGDFLAIVASGEVAILLRHIMAPGQFPVQPYAALLLYSALILMVYAVVGLYVPVASGGPEELRRLTLTTTALVAVMGIVTYVSRTRFDAAVWMFVFAWSFAIFVVPLTRALVRTIFSRFRWWGRNAIVIGLSGRSTNRIAQAIRRDPRLGLIPVAILTGEAPVTDSDSAPGVPRLLGLGPIMEYQKRQDVDYAIVTLSLLESNEGPELIRRYETYFKHWLLVPTFPHGYSLWVKACDLNGKLALELTHRLLRKSDRIIKQAMDLVLTLVGGVIVLPLSLLIALAIRLDSPGPILYSQERIGKSGKSFSAWKFRSMVKNADEILAHYLEGHPEFRKEWAETQKLKNDPRITRVGKFLRKTSLDELPQLLNVLFGEMSLVGPRPIVSDEVSRYDEVWDLYKRVRPGITGQWQISGRNDTSYKERTTMDAYYVRNGSVWLDIYILARTVKVVLFRDGAY